MLGESVQSHEPGIEYVRQLRYDTYMGKLTLSVDEAVVARAKRYATRRGTSVSRLVEQYLHLLSRARPNPDEQSPPVLTRLRGVLKGASGGAADYRRYLERKYR